MIYRCTLPNGTLVRIDGGALSPETLQQIVERRVRAHVRPTANVETPLLAPSSAANEAEAEAERPEPSRFRPPSSPRAPVTTSAAESPLLMPTMNFGESEGASGANEDAPLMMPRMKF